MWTREMTDLLDVLPYYLLVALPVFIILSPINPVDAASELDVHRLAQFELAGNTHGSKQVLRSKRVLLTVKDGCWNFGCSITL